MPSDVVWIDYAEDADLCGFTTPGWYFWDETQSQCYGPYDNWLEAFVNYVSYIKALEEKRKEFICYQQRTSKRQSN